MVVPVCFMIAAWTYAVCVNLVPAYRNPADKIGAATIGLDDKGKGASEDKIDEDPEKNAPIHNEEVG